MKIKILILFLILLYITFSIHSEQTSENSFGNDSKDTVIFIGILASFIVGLYGVLINKRSQYLNIVTSERLKWINALRENISEFLGLAYNWNLKPDKTRNDYEKITKRADELRNLIRLQLNPDEVLTKIIDDCIDKVLKLTDTWNVDDFNSAINEIVKYSRILLKQEWEKIKIESRGLILYYLNKKFEKFVKKT